MLSKNKIKQPKSQKTTMVEREDMKNIVSRIFNLIKERHS